MIPELATRVQHPLFKGVSTGAGTATSARPGAGALALRVTLACLTACAAVAALAQGRPQLDDAQAALQGVPHHLGDWTPADADRLREAVADFVVAPDGTGTHRTVQAAVDAVPAAPGSGRRWVIHIRPGVYEEPLCVRDKAPLLIRGESAAQVRLSMARYASLAKPVGTPAHPCVPALDAAQHGTSGSTTAAVFSDDAQLLELTIANEASAHSQAVALTTAGDRVQLEAVQLWSYQDTLYTRRRERAAPARVFVRNSLVAGDVDFVFGNATLVVTGSELRSRARPGRQGGYVLAPSTLPGEAHGFLVTQSRFTAEAGLEVGSVALGRAWDQGVPAGTWQAGVSPQGRALVRDSELGPHIGPWGPSTSRRPVDASNLLFEYRNRPLSAP